ncbi:hypothetical protein R3P38DRAFT_3184987 [Favolaschia claudopus]|uniref:Uncharacterized protein n=1 Tax=Favolaschia claudopus TaxID=2862362 RepID=A0AAW0C7I9_9AGAR
MSFQVIPEFGGTGDVGGCGMRRTYVVSSWYRPPRRDLGRSGRKSGFRGRFCVDKAYLERDPIKFFRWISNSPPRCGKPAVFPLFKSFCRSTRAFSTDSDTTGTRSTIKCSAAKQHSNLDVVGRGGHRTNGTHVWLTFA